MKMANICELFVRCSTRRCTKIVCMDYGYCFAGGHLFGYKKLLYIVDN